MNILQLLETQQACQVMVSMPLKNLKNNNKRISLRLKHMEELKKNKKHPA